MDAGTKFSCRDSAVMGVRVIHRKNITRKVNAAIDASKKATVAATKRVAKGLDEMTKDWKSKPEFKITITDTRDRFSAVITPSGENADIFTFVDQGTRPHIIRPKRARTLVFRVKEPKTKRTVESGGVVFATRVSHPGTKPQGLFEQAIEKIDFKELVENSFKSKL